MCVLKLIIKKNIIIIISKKNHVMYDNEGIRKKNEMCIQIQIWVQIHISVDNKS